MPAAAITLLQMHDLEQNATFQAIVRSSILKYAGTLITNASDIANLNDEEKLAIAQRSQAGNPNATIFTQSYSLLARQINALVPEYTAQSPEDQYKELQEQLLSGTLDTVIDGAIASYWPKFAAIAASEVPQGGV